MFLDYKLGSITSLHMILGPNRINMMREIHLMKIVQNGSKLVKINPTIIIIIFKIYFCFSFKIEEKHEIRGKQGDPPHTEGVPCSNGGVL